ncbi:MAG: hypothetical protein V1870_03040 [Candidatus Aenigmatarchaeota archaeon]
MARVGYLHVLNNIKEITTTPIRKLAGISFDGLPDEFTDYIKSTYGIEIGTGHRATRRYDIDYSIAELTVKH